MMRRPFPLLALGVAVALVAAACGGDDGGGGGAGGGDRAPADLPECPIGAAAEAGETVELEFWHSLPEENLAAIEAITERFNSSQDVVEVSLVAQASYDETLTRFTSGLSTGDIPGLVMLEDTATQTMIDSQSVLPAQSCVDADDYDLEQFLPRLIDYYTVDDVLWPMPFNTSNPVMYYNKRLFEEADLDPDSPPTTFEELRAAAEALDDVITTPISLKLDPWYIEMWLAIEDLPYVDNDNGRSAAATELLFDNEQGVEIFEFLDGLSDDGLLTTASRDGFDNLLAIGNVQAAISFDTSAALGTAVTVIEAGTFPEVSLDDIGVAPLPTPTADAAGGTFVAGGSIYLVGRDTPPEVQDAAWTYAKFLNEPENLAEFAGRSGYIPTTEAAAETQFIQDLWAESPFFQVAYDQLATGPETVATAGPVMGNFTGVREIVVDQMTAMFNQDKAPADALADAASEGNRVLQEYNQSVGR